MCEGFVGVWRICWCVTDLLAYDGFVGVIYLLVCNGFFGI